MATEGAAVCVTGAGGFIASWLVKELLERGYTAVHGTVRDPDAPRNAHLKNLPNAEKLKLFKANLLDYASLEAAIAGCQGVFHVASPVIFHQVQNAEEEIIAPAVTGTLNVLKACKELNVRRVVVTSSIAATVGRTGYWNCGRVIDEECWSDEELFRSSGFWYPLAKTLAERAALDFAKTSGGLQVVSVCPSYTYGPMLQAEVNYSSSILLNLLKERSEAAARDFKNAIAIVDVRDVADALILAFESEQASGRYICTAAGVDEVVDKLLSLYPDDRYSFLKSFDWSLEISVEFSAKKLESLGWKSRSIEDILKDSIESYKSAGFL